jgi:hypothetical protein
MRLLIKNNWKGERQSKVEKMKKSKKDWGEKRGFLRVGGLGLLKEERMIGSFLIEKNLKNLAKFKNY